MIIDDMISSGESMLDVARELKRRKARRVFCISTFGMFTNGLESFDKAYEEGLIYKVITTNCTYQRPDLFERPWYVSCDVAKYIALLIDSINHEASISAILNPHDRITKRLEEYKQFHTIKEEKQELATLAGLKQSTVDNIIRGTSKNPKVRTLHKIANVFGMTLSESLDFPELNNYSIDDEDDDI